MKSRLLALSCFALLVGFSRLLAANAPAAPAKPGHRVVLDLSIDEKGVSESAKVVESDDPTGDRILEQIALINAKNLTQPPKIQGGVAVKYTVRVPFDFPVEGDEGAAANLAPRPAVRTAVQPLFPDELAAKGINGGVILELNIGSYGNVENAKVIRATHKEYADSAVKAVKTWIFSPAFKDGRPVESRWRIAFSFSANATDIDWQWRVAPRPSLGSYTVVRAKVPPADAAKATPPAK